MFTPVRRRWDARELFMGLTSAMFAASPSDVRARWTKLWPDLYTEDDARYLKQELETRNLIASNEAAAFFNAWAIDEERHTDGFIRVIELVAGGCEQALREQLESRSHDFGPVLEHLNDEFSLTVLIAFDEMCTCRAYAAEKPFYDNLGNSAFHHWLRELIADEAVHSMNAVNVIRVRYRDRIGQVGTILDNLISAADTLRYSGTFVLDYFGAVYSKELLADSRLATIRNISNPLK
ncbi:hypothetical protein [Bradyrhizobium centrosematis]|uniref:hypothetical protein n=1 Tax=Bradyrhizobium centrosematis TaxID=1300039 RepID=UPI00388D5C4A